MKAQNESNWEEVIRLITNYIDFDENNDSVFSIRSHAYYKLFDTTLNEDFLNKSLKDTDEMLRLDLNSSWAYIQRGNIYFFKNDFDNALSNYNEGIRLQPDYGLAYYNRSLVFDRKGMVNEKEQDLAKSKELGYDPNK